MNLDCSVATLLAMTISKTSYHSLLPTLIKRIQQFEQVSAFPVMRDDVGEEVGSVLFSGGVAHEGLHEPGVVHEMLKNVAGEIDAGRKFASPKLLVAAQRRRFVVALKRMGDRFSGVAAGFQRVVDAFAGDRVDEASCVTREQHVAPASRARLQLRCRASGWTTISAETEHHDCAQEYENRFHQRVHDGS